MTTMAIDAPQTGGMTSEQRLVIFASSLGTVFEWYDFYIYGTLGAFLAKYFFSNVPANVGFIFALLAFAAGFAVRPFGALIFGRLGDMIGRKYTFLVTMTLMGRRDLLHRRATGLRHLGHHGAGAADCAAAHPRPRARWRIRRRGDLRRRARTANKRGFYTSWIQTTATLGLFLALLLILGIRTSMGEDDVRQPGAGASHSCSRQSCWRSRSGSGSSSTSRRCSSRWSRRASSRSGR